MQEEIRYVKETGADGVVLGILLADGRVDRERTAQLVEWASPMKVTFHRAFDMTCDPRAALEEVIESGCYRILTSGMHNTAPEGADVLKELVEQAQGRIQIMAGSGVNASNARFFTGYGRQRLTHERKKRARQ